MTNAPSTEARPVPSAEPSMLSRWVGHPGFWVVWVAAIFSAAILRTLTLRAPEPPPVMMDIGEFELVDQDGQPFGSKDLEDKVWIANFVFTRCETVCPMLSAKMVEVRHSVKNLTPYVHLVSFSVDPAYDTPEVLREYSTRYQASPQLWKFLTGEPEEVRRTVVDVLKMTLDDTDVASDLQNLTHSSYLVLVGPGMKLRGLYEVGEQSAVRDLIRDIKGITAEGHW